jgi:alginate O-acetyltransferase complex protein AlgJ
MFKKLIQVLLIAAFWSALVFVGVQTLRFPTTATTENRVLAQKPPVPTSWSGIPNYVQTLEAWWSDSMAFRQLFVREFSLLRLNVGIGPQKNVLLGKDGWLFDSSEQLDDFRNSKLLTDDELNAWREYLVFRHLDAKKRGAKFLFVIVPNKESVYAEFMPDNVTKLTTTSRTDQIVEVVKNDGVAVLDLRSILEEGKKNNLRVYHQNDIHWNLIGANYGQYAITKALAPDFPKLTPALHPLDDFEFVDGNRVNEAGIPYYGGLSLMMGLAELRGELEPIFKTARPQCAEPAELKVVPWDSLSQEQKAATFKATACKTGHYRALVFRDSFTELMFPYLSETFSYIAYLWLPRPIDMGAWNYFLDVTHPDIVIDQNVERFLEQIPRVGVDYPGEIANTSVAASSEAKVSTKAIIGVVPWESLNDQQKSVLSMLEEVWILIPTEKQKSFMLDADKWFTMQPEEQGKVIADLERYRDSDQ